MLAGVGVGVGVGWGHATEGVSMGLCWASSPSPHPPAPTRQPFCPDVKPAFGEICITWELSYPHSCLTDLIKRVSRHLKRHPLAHLKFHTSKGCHEQARAEEQGPNPNPNPDP